MRNFISRWFGSGIGEAWNRYIRWSTFTSCCMIRLLNSWEKWREVF